MTVTPVSISADDILALLDAADSADGFDPRVITATVTAANDDVATVTYTNIDGTVSSGRLPVSEFGNPGKWVVGRTYLMLQLDDSPRPLVSTADIRFVTALLDGISPEIRTGKVRVMDVARRPGQRTKVAVAATVDGIDPVAACVGRSHNRIDTLREALGGEQVDIVAWNPDIKIFLANALQPAQCVKVWTDPEKPVALAVAPDHQMSSAVGGNGLNSLLAGQLVKHVIRVVPESKMKEIPVLNEQPTTTNQ